MGLVGLLCGMLFCQAVRGRQKTVTRCRAVKTMMLPILYHILPVRSSLREGAQLLPRGCRTGRVRQRRKAIKRGRKTHDGTGVKQSAPVRRTCRNAGRKNIRKSDRKMRKCRSDTRSETQAEIAGNRREAGQRPCRKSGQRRCSGHTSYSFGGWRLRCKNARGRGHSQWVTLYLRFTAFSFSVM